MTADTKKYTRDNDEKSPRLGPPMAVLIRYSPRRAAGFVES
jgi:hypothetical protein